MTLRAARVYLLVATVAIAGIATYYHLLTASTPKTYLESGVVTTGNSKTNCIYSGSSTWKEGLKKVETATGIQFNCVETFSTVEATWNAWVDPWVTHSYGFVQWLAAGRKNRTIILTQQLIPDSVCTSDCADPLKWEATCDAGSYDTYAILLAKRLVSVGFGSSVIRLGAEMNGSWENDYAGTTTTEQRDWAKCFVQEVEAMRSVKGARFLFDWDVNACVDNDSLSDIYPGSAYVNIVGIDAYDSRCDGKPLARGPASAFAQFTAEPDGLNAVTSFAKSKSKPMSLPEWGAVSVGDFGVGDNGSYILGVKRYVARHDFAFQCYFDDGDGGVLKIDASNPNVLAAYVDSFK